jgi:hypothetical protein
MGDKYDLVAGFKFEIFIRENEFLLSVEADNAAARRQGKIGNAAFIRFLRHKGKNRRFVADHSLSFDGVNGIGTLVKAGFGVQLPAVR